MRVSLFLDQRFYASSYGRFNTPDRKRRSAKRHNPGSWNRYAYTLGDPINRNDPRGLETEETCGGTDDGDTGGDDDCGAGGVMVDDDEYDNNPDPPMASATGTGCIQDGLTYTGGTNGTCDLPLYGPYVPGLQQVGQNMGGFNSLMTAVAAPYALPLIALAPEVLAGVEAATSLTAAVSQPVAVMGSVADTLPLATNTMYNVLPAAGWLEASKAATRGATASNILE
jgi:RHS repeat-associated protein